MASDTDPGELPVDWAVGGDQALARQAIQSGIDQLADAVKATLGPHGHFIVVPDLKFGSPSITKDGVTVAKEMAIRDPLESIGAQMVRDVASRTSDTAGDGTTTATVLAQAIYREGAKNVAAGANPVDLKRGIGKAVDAITGELKKMAKSVSANMVMQVGTLSANNDATIGKIIADAMERVGSDGVITVEEAEGLDTSFDVVRGMQFDRGYLSRYFVTDLERMEVVLENPIILTLQRTIRSMTELLPTLESVARLGRPLLLIAEDFEGEALAVLVANKLRGTLQVAAVRAPESGDRRHAVLEDIATLTGGHVITANPDITPADFGRARRVILGKAHTTIIAGGGTASAIDDRVRQIRAQIDDATPDYDRQKLQERLAKLAGGVAVIKVGAATETEMKAKKARIEGAMHATKAAVEEGIVPGGGVALIRASKALDRLNLGGDQQIGVDIVRHAIEAPARWIASNAGHEGAAVVEKLRTMKGAGGFNARTGAYQNLMRAGVIDPAKVVRSALESSSSIASELLTIEHTPQPAAAAAPSVPTESPASRGRTVNAWLAGTALPLVVGEKVPVGFSIGEPRPAALAQAVFQEPPWVGETSRELWVMLWANDADVEPDGYDVILPRSGGTRSVFFVLTPRRAGDVTLRFLIYLKSESSLLQELTVAVPAIAAVEAGASA